MNTVQNPPVSRPISLFSLSREIRVCLSVVVASHLLLIGWLCFNGFAPEADMTPPITGMLISGGSGTGSGIPEKASGNSGAAGMAASNAHKKNDRPTGKQASVSVSKPEQATRPEPAKNAALLPEEKTAASSALSGREITGTQTAGSAGKGTGQDTKNGTGKSAGGTGSSGHGGSGFSGPYTDAGFFSNPKPPYPPVSRRMAEEGTVLLSVHIRADGQVDDVKLKRSSGFSRLDDSAIRTVKHWRYVPAKRNGQPIPYWYAQPIRFSLDEE